MLKKVRWRFIGSAMAAFTAVILILLLVLNIWNYRSVSHQQDDALQMLLNTENGGETPPEKPEGSNPPEAPDGTQLPAALPPDSWRQFSREVQYSFRYFSVRYDADGTQEGVNCTAVASITEEEAAAYSDTVLAGGKTSGYYAGYRFRVQSTADGTTVIFLNSERELQAVRSLLLLTIAIACGCLLGVFALVLLFSRRAIAPYLRNLSVQKQFITNAGHELKTPLTAISTSADVLAMEYPGDEWAENIQAQSARLARLIADLVTLSRLDEENPFPEKTEFSLSDAVWEIAEPFSSLAAAKGKRYSQEIEDGVLLTGDRQAVQQMVSILLDNAVKYSDEGGEISLWVSKAGKKAQIQVFNTCAGAEKLDISRLFDRFYRADESHSSAVGGTGIGLSIARATAEAHGGSIRAEIADGGIRFTALL